MYTSSTIEYNLNKNKYSITECDMLYLRKIFLHYLVTRILFPYITIIIIGIMFKNMMQLQLCTVNNIIIF